MTEQETFDTVRTNLLAQGRKSQQGTNGACMYRGREGCKCAAGWLIPDTEYDPATMEGQPVFIGPQCQMILEDWFSSGETGEDLEQLLSPRAIGIAGRIIQIEGHNLALVAALQFVHDNFEVENWPAGFAKVAKAWGLQ